MAASANAPEPPSSYQVDAENIAGMARLVRHMKISTLF